MQEKIVIERKAEGLEQLICSCLRGEHINKMSFYELQDYVYMVGLALHDIPKNITNNVELSHHQLIQINNLDPTKKMDGWGDWVVCLLDAFNQCVPERTYDEY